MGFFEKADGVKGLEGNTPFHVKRASERSFSGVKEPGMLYKDYIGSWETLRLFLE